MARKPGPVAVIGAGIAGLSCAQALRAAGLEVHVYEQGARAGGRCATRLWQGHLVDYGVPHFTAQTAEFKRELLSRLQQFRPIVPPVLDPAGRIVPSLGGPRFYVLQGNNYFAQVLSHGLDIRLGTRVGTVSFGEEGLELAGGTYRAVISSLPAAQTARLFALPEIGTEDVHAVYALLEYGGLDIGTSGRSYGRVLAAESEPLVASYCENHKAGRIVGNKTVFVVHAGPRFGLSTLEEPQERYVWQLVRANDEVWKIPAGKCTAAFSDRWRLSRTRPGARLPNPLPPGAFACADSRPEPNVEEAWLDGRRTAQEVLQFLAGSGT